MARSSTARKAGGKGSTKAEFREPADDEDDIVIEDERENEDDDDSKNESDDEDDDEDDEELGEGGKKALRAERRKTRSLERELRALKRGNGTREKPKPRSRDKDDEDEDDDPKPSDREARIETRLKKTALSAELIASGVSKSNARLLVGQAKLSNLDLDEDDEVDGRDLEDMVEELKDEYPDLFGSSDKGKGRDDEDDEDPAERRRRVRQRGSGGSSRRPGRERAPQSSADRLASIITGGARR